MARLLDALSPATRSLLVGDPDHRPRSKPARSLPTSSAVSGRAVTWSSLTENRRSVAAIQELARAVRSGDPDEVLGRFSKPVILRSASPRPTSRPLGHMTTVSDQARHLRALALDGDVDGAIARLSRARLLCGRRSGRTAFGAGTGSWSSPSPRTPEVAYQPYYLGRPILITRNDHSLGLANGDTGVLVRGPQGPLAAIQTGQGVRTFSPWRLADVETMHAMTVHKAQGSEADDVTVLVPAPGSRPGPASLLYTATTRARQRLTVIGSRDAIRSAVTTPIERSSALTERP